MTVGTDVRYGGADLAAIRALGQINAVPLALRGIAAAGVLPVVQVVAVVGFIGSVRHVRL